MALCSQRQLVLPNFYKQAYKRNSEYYRRFAMHEIIYILQQIHNNDQLSQNQEYKYQCEMRDQEKNSQWPIFNLDKQLREHRRKITNTIHKILRQRELKWMRFYDTKHANELLQKEIVNQRQPQRQQKQIFKDIVWGYIKMITHNEFGFTNDMALMPYYLKRLIYIYCGHILIFSEILNLNQIILMGFLIRSHLTHNRYLVFTEISKQRNLCLERKDLIIVVKTNTEDILVHFHSVQQDFSIILQSSVSSVPVIYTDINNIFHFTNNYKINLKKQICEIFVKHNPDVVTLGVGPLYSHNLSTKEELSVTKFEIFQLL